MCLWVVQWKAPAKGISGRSTQVVEAFLWAVVALKHPGPALPCQESLVWELGLDLSQCLSPPGGPERGMVLPEYTFWALKQTYCPDTYLLEKLPRCSWGRPGFEPWLETNQSDCWSSQFSQRPYEFCAAVMSFRRDMSTVTRPGWDGARFWAPATWPWSQRPCPSSPRQNGLGSGLWSI